MQISGLYYLEGSYSSPGYCCRVSGGKLTLKFLLKYLFLLIEESVLFLPLIPQARLNKKGLGGSFLYSHLLAVSLMKTWLRREVQLNSNSSRKVTWGQGTRGNGRFFLVEQLQRNKSLCVPPSLCWTPQILAPGLPESFSPSGPQLTLAPVWKTGCPTLQSRA